MGSPKLQNPIPAAEEHPKPIATASTPVHLGFFDPACKPEFNTLGDALFEGNTGAAVESVRRLVNSQCVSIDPNSNVNGITNNSSVCVEAVKKLMTADKGSDDPVIRNAVQDMDERCRLSSNWLAKEKVTFSRADKCPDLSRDLSDAIASNDQQKIGQAAFLLAEHTHEKKGKEGQPVQEHCFTTKAQQPKHKEHLDSTSENAAVDSPTQNENLSPECADVAGQLRIRQGLMSRELETKAREIEKDRRKDQPATLSEAWSKLTAQDQASFAQLGRDFAEKCELPKPSSSPTPIIPTKDEQK